MLPATSYQGVSQHLFCTRVPPLDTVCAAQEKVAVITPYAYICKPMVLCIGYPATKGAGQQVAQRRNCYAIRSRLAVVIYNVSFVVHCSPSLAAIRLAQSLARNQFPRPEEPGDGLLPLKMFCKMFFPFLA